MNDNNNNIDRLVAEKLRQSPSVVPSPQFNGRIMLAVERKARRRAALRMVRNVALGIFVAAVALVGFGVGLLLSVEYLGLGDLVAQMDGYIDSALAMLGELARSSTFKLLALVAVAVTAIMVLPSLRTLGRAAKE